MVMDLEYHRPARTELPGGTKTGARQTSRVRNNSWTRRSIYDGMMLLMLLMMQIMTVKMTCRQLTLIRR